MYRLHPISRPQSPTGAPRKTLAQRRPAPGDPTTPAGSWAPDKATLTEPGQSVLPIATNDGESGRAENRRVQVTVTHKPGRGLVR